jgi:hypothetical protein
VHVWSGILGYIGTNPFATGCTCRQRLVKVPTTASRRVGSRPDSRAASTRHEKPPDAAFDRAFARRRTRLETRRPHPWVRLRRYAATRRSRAGSPRLSDSRIVALHHSADDGRQHERHYEPDRDDRDVRRHRILLDRADLEPFPVSLRDVAERLEQPRGAAGWVAEHRSGDTDDVEVVASSF